MAGCPPGATPTREASKRPWRVGGSETPMIWRAYLRGRLATVGCVDAALAVAAWTQTPDWLPVDAEAAARCPSPALRRVSRMQGRGPGARRSAHVDRGRLSTPSPLNYRTDRCGRLQWGRLEPPPPWRRPRWLWWPPMPR